jgi:hypothetical protein
MSLPTPIRYDQFMSPAHAKAAVQKANDEIYQAIRNEGYFAREAGAKLEACPRFTFPDWTATWRSGWYAADKKLRKEEA